MTMTSTSRRVIYPGAGTTGPFAVPFRFTSADDLLVVVRDVGGGETPIAFTASGAGNATGGTVTTSQSVNAGEYVAILRRPALTQSTSIQNGATYFPKVHEDRFDQITMQLLSLQEQLDRCIGLSPTLDPDDFTLGQRTPLANQVLAWNADASGVESRQVDLASAVLLPGNSRTVPSLTTLLANNIGTEFNVLDYAVPGTTINDGITDATDAFEAAVAEAAATVVGVGATVKLPPGWYVLTRQIVVPPYVRLQGAGMQATKITWQGAAGFALKLGNSATVLSYGTGLNDLAVFIGNAAADGITLYGVADCQLSNVYVEGIPGTGVSKAVQIDGADISAFFVLMQNVHANHVFKGFVHTTTGSVKPTQVTGINCSALCNDTAGSMGIDVQTIGGIGCGDGVTYLGGNMESCATGVNLNATGTTIVGMRFENTQGVASDVTFGPLARNNQIIGGSELFTITDTANHPSNQVIGVPKDEVNSISQVNRLDSTRLSGDTEIQAPAAGGDREIFAQTNGGRLIFQNGPASAALGGGIVMYGSQHATKPSDVVAGVPGGKFRVNGSGIDGGTDWFTVDAITGVTTVATFRHTGATIGFFGAAVGQQVLPTGAGKTVDNVIAALQALGLVKQA